MKMAYAFLLTAAITTGAIFLQGCGTNKKTQSTTPVVTKEVNPYVLSKNDPTQPAKITKQQALEIAQKMFNVKYNSAKVEYKYVTDKSGTTVGLISNHPYYVVEYTGYYPSTGGPVGSPAPQGGSYREVIIDPNTGTVIISVSY